MFFKSFVFIALLIAVTANIYRPHLGYVIPLFDNRVDTAQEAAVTEFPWLVSLQWGWLSGYSHFCSGAMVRRNWIVTAGQCALSIPTYGDFVVKAGKFNLKDKDTHEEVVGVTKIIVHPSFNGNIGSSDIALIKLDTLLGLSNWIQTINVTTKMDPKADPLTGNATLAGWGSTSSTTTPILSNRVQKVTVPLMDYITCRNNVQKLAGPNPVDLYNICTGTLENGFPAYIADTGSPLVITNSTTKLPQLLGIASWGIFPAGTVDAPLIYTDIRHYAEWINNTIALN